MADHGARDTPAAAQIARPSAGQQKNRRSRARNDGCRRQSCEPGPEARSESHMRPTSREHNILCTQPQAGLLTRVLPRGSFPFAGCEQWIGPLEFQISDLRSQKAGASGISDEPSEQTLTAARPSRNFTAFPFRVFQSSGALKPAAEVCTSERTEDTLACDLPFVKRKILLPRGIRRDAGGEKDVFQAGQKARLEHVHAEKVRS